MDEKVLPNMKKMNYIRRFPEYDLDFKPSYEL